MASAISINDQDVLLAIDLQADFMPGGALAVEGGDEIVPLVNQLARRFDHVVLTVESAVKPCARSNLVPRSPDARPVTSEPTAAISPAASWPNTAGRFTASAPSIHPPASGAKSELANATRPTGANLRWLRASMSSTGDVAHVPRENGSAFQSWLSKAISSASG